MDPRQGGESQRRAAGKGGKQRGGKQLGLPCLAYVGRFLPLFGISWTQDSSQFATGNISGKIGERKRLPSIPSDLLLAAAIGVIEALALILGSGILLNIMGVSHASAMQNPARLFISVRALGAPAVVVSLAIQGVFRGLKDIKTPLLYSGLGNISAVVLLSFSSIGGMLLGRTLSVLITMTLGTAMAACRHSSYGRSSNMAPPDVYM